MAQNQERLSLNKEDYLVKKPTGLRSTQKLEEAFFKTTQKPIRAFGIFKPWLKTLSTVQNLPVPVLHRPAMLVFCTDHGYYLKPETSKRPSGTAISMLNILKKGSSFNIHNSTAGFHYRLVDTGVNYNFEKDLNFWLNYGQAFIGAKIGEGTANFLKYPAITSHQANRAITLGAKLVQREHYHGSNFLALAGLAYNPELANLTLLSALLDENPGEILSPKRQTLYYRQNILAQAKKALAVHPKTHDVFTLLCLFGSFEIAALIGGIIKAAQLKVTICIDGTNALMALFIANKIAPGVRYYTVFANKPKEALGKKLFKLVKGKALLNTKQAEQTGVASCQALTLFKHQLSSL